MALETAFFKEPISSIALGHKSPVAQLSLGAKGPFSSRAGQLITSTVDLDLVELIPIFIEEAGSFSPFSSRFPCCVIVGYAPPREHRSFGR